MKYYPLMMQVGGNRYSIPEALCGQPVSIRISLDDELRIYSNEQQVSMVEHRPLSAYEELLRCMNLKRC